MGNAIQKRFNLPTNHTATAGHVNNWKIWPGKGKDGGQLVSIWAFDKSDLTKRKLNPVADKAIVEQVFQIMKRDFGVIKDSKACSNIIQILEVVEDSKNGIAFTTERIICSLADVLNNFENIPGGAAEHASFFESGAAISEMEISRGLLNVTLALQYLHTVQRKLHLNLTPEDIVITATGQWKLCGFGFALNFIQGETQRLASPYFMQAVPITTTSLVSRLEPDLRYAAPECTDGGLNPPGVRYLTPVADMFSLGMVFYEIYRFNLKFTPAERSYTKPLIPITNNDCSQHHNALSILQGVDFSFLPQGVVSIVSSIMQLNVQFRGSSADVVSNAYFVTGSQAVLNMVESMHTRDLGTQSSQLLSLQPVLVNIPPRMLIHSFIPAISKLCIATPNLWVYALPLHAELSVLLPEDKYVYYAGPYLAQGLTNIEAPNETVQVFLSSVQFISRYFGAEFFQANVTVLFCNALEKPVLYIQNLALEKLSEQYVYTMFNATSLVEKLMPVLCKMACKHAEFTIKVQALYIISLLTHKLDESYIAANILTSLKYIADHEKNPLVSMSVVGNFESISNTLGLNYVATSVLPILQNMLLDSGLDRHQFEIVVNMIKRLLKKIIDKRTTELKMPTISVAEVPGSEVVDPFTNAKLLIQQCKDKNIANNYGLIAGSYKQFSGERAITNTNTSHTSAYTVTAPVKHSSVSSGGGGSSVGGIGYGGVSASLGAYESGSATSGSSGGNGMSSYTAGASGALPPAPSKAPPPPPSAPPPSVPPPSVPVAGVVAGFGSNVNTTPLGPAATASINLTGAATSTSAGGFSSNSYGSSYPTPAAYGTATTASNTTQPGVGAYQSSFGSTSGTTSSANGAVGGYGTPLTPLDSGLPGFSGTTTLTPTPYTTTPYTNTTSTATPYNTSVTGIGSGPLGEETEKKSRFSFFGSSKKNATTPTSGSNKESLMDSSGADLYVPPVVPNANYGGSVGSSGVVGSSGGMYGTSSAGMGGGMSGGSGNMGSGGAPDLDDFLSSFGSTAPANTMNSGSSGMGGGMGGVSSAGASGGYRSSFGASTGSYATAPTAGYGAGSGVSGKSVGSVGSVGSTTSGLSIEQQIAQAQAEIARLSTNNNTSSGGMGGGTSGGVSGGMMGSSSAWPQQQQQYGNTNTSGGMYQQPYTAPAPYTQPYTSTYTPPATYPNNAQYPQYNNTTTPNAANNTGTIPGYSYNPNTNNFSNMNRNGTGGMNGGMGGGNGYQPPQANNNNGAKPKGDAFDFLS